jgi:hypothetical protein
MDDELLAGATALVGVVLAGEHERGLHTVAVDCHQRVLGVLLDDREEVAEQLPLALGQDGDIRRGRRRDLLYAAYRVVNPRYLRPSSRVCW